MANSVDPFRNSLIWVYNVWPDLFVGKHRIRTDVKMAVDQAS